MVAISSGKLSAKAKHIKPSTTQKGEVFRMETLVLEEKVAEGVGHFFAETEHTITTKAESGKTKSIIADAIP